MSFFVCVYIVVVIVRFVKRMINFVMLVWFSGIFYINSWF